MHKKNSEKSLYKWLFLSAVIFLLAYYISNNWYQLMMIQGRSMEPTYHNLQLVILDRHSTSYTYGDVIAFYCASLDSVMVKRIAACPGDRVIIIQGVLYVNGSVSTIYDKNVSFEYAGMLENEIQLKSEQYIALGDNVAESKDSRFTEVGCIDKNDIIGKITSKDYSSIFMKSNLYPTRSYSFLDFLPFSACSCFCSFFRSLSILTLKVPSVICSVSANSLAE